MDGGASVIFLGKNILVGRRRGVRDKFMHVIVVNVVDVRVFVCTPCCLSAFLSRCARVRVCPTIYLAVSFTLLSLTCRWSVASVVSGS